MERKTGNWKVLCTECYNEPISHKTEVMKEMIFRDKYPFIEPDIEANKRFIQNNELFLGLLHLKEFKEPIIEIGCGTGKYLKLLEMSGKKKIVGIDISKNEIGIAKKYLKYSKLEQGNALGSRFKHNSFEIVMCCGVAHHTPSPRGVFNECVRICKYNGRIVFAIYRKHSLYYWDYLLFNRIVKLIFKMKIEKIFYPLLKLWFLFLDGNWADNKLLLSKTSDRYLTPVVKFFSEEDILWWIIENDLKLITKSSICRDSVMTFLIEK